MVTCGSERVNGETLQNNENKIQRKQIPPSVNSILQKGKLGHKGEQFTQQNEFSKRTNLDNESHWISFPRAAFTIIIILNWLTVNPSN